MSNLNGNETCLLSLHAHERSIWPIHNAVSSVRNAHVVVVTFCDLVVLQVCVAMDVDQKNDLCILGF